MHKKIILIKIILFVLLFVSCEPILSETWLFEWKFLNSEDNTAITGNYSYNISVDQVDNVEDTSLRDGLLMFEIHTQGTDENYIKQFPLTAKLNLKLESNNITVMDTIIPMNSLKFIRGYSKLYNQEMRTVNYDTLFVSDSRSQK